MSFNTKTNEPTYPAQPASCRQAMKREEENIDTDKATLVSLEWYSFTGQM